MNDKKQLKVYFTSDLHGYFYPTSYGDCLQKEMGLFRCASAFEKDENTLIIDGGDNLQGSAFAYFCKQKLESNQPMAQIMNDCGYDIVTIGNHDFNYGRTYQKEYLDALQATCVCENVTDLAGNTLYPSVIRVMENGLRVGLVGIVTEYVNVWEKPENIKEVRITDPIEAARKVLASWKDKVDLTICIYHGGFERDLDSDEILSNSKENVACKICEELDFDILLTGHQHMSVDGRYYHDTYIVQPMDAGKEYQYLEITVENGQKHVKSERHAANHKPDQILVEKNQALEDQVQAWLNQPIGTLSEALVAGDKLEMALHGSKIADFFNRIQLYASGADLSSVGLANEIAGFHEAVTTRDIIATYPYPNTLVVLEITGKQLKAAMERSAEYFQVKDGKVLIADAFLQPKVEHYNYDYYAGVTYDIEPANAVGSRIINLAYKGKKVEEDNIFTICINNYRASGAGGYPMYTECKVVKEINIEMVELIMDYFVQNPHVIIG